MKFSYIRKFILVNAFIILLLLLAFYFDKKIIYLISLMGNGILNDFFLGITFVSSILIVFLFLTILFIKENKRKWIVPLWITLAIDIAIGFLLKVSVQRLRPFQLGLVSIIPSLEKASHDVWDFSFPSFQSMMIFSAIPFLSKEFPRFKYVWIIFACLVAISRAYFGLHFLSDVIAGALIGYMIGYFVVRRIGRR